MRRQAESEGYGSSRREADTQRMLGGGEMLPEPQADKAPITAVPNFTTRPMPHMKYHTLF